MWVHRKVTRAGSRALKDYVGRDILTFRFRFLTIHMCLWLGRKGRCSGWPPTFGFGREARGMQILPNLINLS